MPLPTMTSGSLMAAPIEQGDKAGRRLLLHLSPRAGRGRIPQQAQRGEGFGVSGHLHRFGLAAAPPHPTCCAPLASRPLPASGERSMEQVATATTSRGLDEAVALVEEFEHALAALQAGRVAGEL